MSPHTRKHRPRKQEVAKIANRLSSRIILWLLLVPIVVIAIVVLACLARDVVLSWHDVLEAKDVERLINLYADPLDHLERVAKDYGAYEGKTVIMRDGQMVAIEEEMFAGFADDPSIETARIKSEAHDMAHSYGSDRFLRQKFYEPLARQLCSGAYSVSIGRGELEGGGTVAFFRIARRVRDKRNIAVSFMIDVNAEQALRRLGAHRENSTRADE